jgi:DNA-binding response OmpR family regulator
MVQSKLQGLSILIVEDEPLIALDIAEMLESEGARVAIAGTVKQAFALVEHARVAAGILDHALSEGDTSALCRKLDDLNIPYLIYTGASRIEGPCSQAPVLDKPASYDELVAAVLHLFAGPKLVT